MLTILPGRLGAQAPSVNRSVSGAAAPGKSTDLTLYGSGLDAPTALWTSVPATATFTAGSGDHATCRITLPPEAQVGVVALRVGTRGGVSNPYLFMVDDLPSVASAGGNTAPAKAQEIVPPVAVDGACDALGLDYYRFKAKRGQRLSFEVVAARLASALDPVMRLLDPSGRELAWADDSAGAGGDCRFAHTFAADGEYLLELRDVGYDGGPAYRYRLRVGDFPLPVVPFPLGGRRGTAGLFTLLGEGCEGVPPALVALPREGMRFGISGRHSSTGGSGFAGVLLGDADETVEAEPNDTPAAATPLAIPAAVNGRFETPGDIDCYKVRASKGERLTFRARGRSLGSPCDVSLQWLREGGGKIAESKVEGAADPALDVTVPEDGTYVLRVEEISRAGGPALAYRLEAARHRPGFALAVETDKVDAKAGGEFQLKVTRTRGDYGGAVALSLPGLTPAAVEGATIPAGKQETQLKVKLPADLKAGSIVPFTVVGTGTAGGEEVRAVASTAASLKKLFPRLLYPPEDLDGVVVLGVRAE